jgi:hypothetical protein
MQNYLIKFYGNIINQHSWFVTIIFLVISTSTFANTNHWHDTDYIIRSFSEIALQKSSSPKKSYTIKKWRKEIKFHFIHGIADKKLHEELTGMHLQHLSQITGLGIKHTRDYNRANLIIMFSNEKNMLHDFTRETGLKPTASITKLTNESVCLSYMKFNGAGQIRRATVIIPVDRARERAKLLTCIVEELSEVMGLPNDSEKVFPSIFNDKSYNDLLTGLDYLMLKILYDNRVKAGMNKRQLFPLLTKIIKEFKRNNIVKTAELKVMEGSLYPLLY